jgi:RNA polymerase sigma factor (TIGR02999 family)
VTQILEQLARGDRSAADRLLPHVYDELRALAASFFARQPRHHTLQPTALVHEAYLKMVGSARPDWNDKRHFFDVAALAMRQLLTDHARRRGSQKRGGGLARVTLTDSDAPAGGMFDLDLEALDEALTRLAALDPRQGRIVELRYLAGLTVEETADVLGVSPRTVRLEWQVARAWLRRERSSLS